MLKLRHLFYNPDLAIMLLKNWEYDEDSLDLLNQFRISANAIYPFRHNNEVFFLRCCPTSEKLESNLMAELEWIGYLREQGYPAMEPWPSKTKELLIKKVTPWEDYYASVFKRVAGDQLSETNLDDELMFTFGEALGRLHALSKAYTQPRTKRWSYIDVFNWMEVVLRGIATEKNPLIELELLRKYFDNLPAHPENFGLIHYDFELDNVFYDVATKTCSVIDFDDAMYHWYMMDIVQTLNNLKEELPEQEYPARKAAFLRGYRSQFALDETKLPSIPACERFARLYNYTRVVRALQESWDNEPEWLVGLRGKLERLLTQDAEQFGHPI
jgi:Ser/Thr protein kinase RdoA (MazF antagonist)